MQQNRIYCNRTWIAEEILELWKENKEIQLECVIPFPGASGFMGESRSEAQI